jgi:thermitase
MFRRFFSTSARGGSGERPHHTPRPKRGVLSVALAVSVAVSTILGGATAGPVSAGPSVQSSAPPDPGHVYPHVETEVEIGRGQQAVKVRPLKTVRTAHGREALAERLIVRFREGAGDAARVDTHRQAGPRGGMTARAVLQIGPASDLVDVSGAPSLEAAARAYRADPRVLYVGPDYIARVHETTNDPRFPLQWGMAKIEAPAAWDRTHGSTTRRIAILDTGIRETHPDLASKVVARRSFVSSGPWWDPAGADEDVRGHGTHVAGIAAAVTNNGRGVAGIGYNTRLLNGKVCNDSGQCPHSAVAGGIYWAADNGAHVINMSLGSEQDCEPAWYEDFFDVGVKEIKDAINYASAKKVVLVASAGNDSNTSRNMPASCPNVLAVASTTSSDGKSSFSSYGASWVDVAAPGSSIWSTAVVGAPDCWTDVGGVPDTTSADPADGYASCSGTSMAAPHVAGLAALVGASCNLTSAQAIVDRITESADPIAGTGTYWEHGRINAARAVFCFPAPSNLRRGTVTASSVQILWNDTTPSESRFEVNHRPHGTGGWSPVVPAPAANSTSWTHSGLVNGARYDYRVRACDAVGCSAWSNIVSIHVGGKTLSVKATGVRVTSNPPGISCGLTVYDCTEQYPSGTSVTLTAIGALGSPLTGLLTALDHWEGACSGTSNPCVVTMTDDRAVTAVSRSLGP